MYTRWQKAWEKHIDFIVLDLLCMTVAFGLGYISRHGLNSVNNTNMLLYGRLLGVLIFVNLCVIFFLESYKDVVRRGYVQELKKTFLHCLVVDFIMLLYLFVTKQSEIYSRETLLVFCVLWFGISYIVRSLRKHTIRVKMLYDPDVEQMLILTDFGHMDSTVTKLIGEKYRNYRIVGVALLEEDLKTANDVTLEQFDDEIAASLAGNVVTGMDGLSEYILNHVVDSVFVDISLGEKEMRELSQMLIRSGVIVHLNLAEMSYSSEHSMVEKIGDFTVMTSGMRIATVRQYFIKRLMDIVGGFVGCVCTLMLMLLIGPVIYIQSPGPIFFKQQRVGKNGRIFYIYKFRSMYMDAEERKKELMEENEMDGFMFKMKDDPRIIPIGHFIRRCSLDEFPQFFNVLKGDMSLVGTRPPTLDEFEQYQLHHRGRLGFRPGITGLWQVSGRSNITNFEEVVALDTEYIMNWSVGKDIGILWKTVKQVVKGDGAV